MKNNDKNNENITSALTDKERKREERLAKKAEKIARKEAEKQNKKDFAEWKAQQKTLKAKSRQAEKLQEEESEAQETREEKLFKNSQEAEIPKERLWGKTKNADLQAENTHKDDLNNENASAETDLNENAETTGSNAEKALTTDEKASETGKKTETTDEKTQKADGVPNEKDEPISRKKAKKTLYMTQEQFIAAEVKRIASRQSTDAEWINLDNAALIFPAAENADKSNMFRISVLLKKPVDPLVLQSALNETVPRFPSITSAVKHGLFWYYLEPSNRPLVIEKQKDFPMRKIPLDARHALIRVTYFNCEVSVEFFHAATDGTGAVTYVNSLMYCYFRLLKEKEAELAGEKPSEEQDADMFNCLDTRDRPRPEELADSFQTCFDHRKKGENKAVKAYYYKCKRLPGTALILTKGIADSEELNRAAARKNVTVTELLTAILIWAINEDRMTLGKDGKKPIVISVPVNLRRLYPSKTIRNFVSMMAIKHGTERDFDVILESVRKQFAEQNTTEFFDKLVGFNVNAQHNPVIKLMPLFIKNAALSFCSRNYGDKSRTISFSNLGKIKAPESFREHIVRYEFSLGPMIREGIDIACASFNGVCVMSFSKTTKDSAIERSFFNKLSEMGVKIAVETNYEY